MNDSVFSRKLHEMAAHFVAMPFDLMNYLADRFPALQLDGGLFYRWPMGIRFDLGGPPAPSSQRMTEVLNRAASLYEAIFTVGEKCIVIAQEWKSDDTPLRYTNLFNTPGTDLPGPQGSYEVRVRDESGDDHSHTLRWSETAARDFQYRTILLGIGNADHGLVPAISGRVYFLNAERGLIMHMYDDRGLDVIACEAEPLRSIYQKFNSWILDYDRSQIDQVFKPPQH